MERLRLRRNLKNYKMNHEESKLQQQCVAWFRAQYPQYAMLLVHPINEGSGHTTTDRRRQGIHKAEGAVAGVPDLILFMPAIYEGLYPVRDIAGNFVGPIRKIVTFHGLGVEMKTKTGKQSQSQKDYQMMFETAGYKYIVVRSLDEFRNRVSEYVGNTDGCRRREIASAHVEITKAAEQREREKFYKIIGKKPE